jgi:sortase A
MMPMEVRLGRVVSLVLLVLFTAATCAVTEARADSFSSGPVISLSRTNVTSGDRMTVTLKGFSAPVVTLSICGNKGQRGSGDCNMVMSKGVRVQSAMYPTITPFGVSVPPVGCPCIVRASSLNGDEIAVAPITLAGHPDSPVIDPPKVDGPFLVASVTAEPAPNGAVGWVRSNLGGPFRYRVTVTVKNLSTEPLHQPRLSGSVSRNTNENLVDLNLVDPGEIGVGQTWQETVDVVVPAPSFGTLTWGIAVSGAGPTVSATSSTPQSPILLLVMAMLLIVNLTILAMRWTIRRRVAKGLTSIDDEGAITQATGLATA